MSVEEGHTPEFSKSWRPIQELGGILLHGASRLIRERMPYQRSRPGSRPASGRKGGDGSLQVDLKRDVIGRAKLGGRFLVEGNVAPGFDEGTLPENDVEGQPVTTRC